MSDRAHANGDGAERPRLLFLAHLLPWPLEGGGQIKSYHTLRLLSQWFDVTMLAFIRSESEKEHIAHLLPLCKGGVHTVLLPRGKGRDVRLAVQSLLNGRSFIMDRDCTRAMGVQFTDSLRKAISNYKPFVAVHMDHLQMALYWSDGHEQHILFDSSQKGLMPPRIVLDQHNIEHRIPQRIAGTPGGLKSLPSRWYARGEWQRLRNEERAACLRADRVLCVSDEDAHGLDALDPALPVKMRVIPIGVDTAYWGAITRKPDATDIVSVGTMYWPPNVDGMLWFCRDVLPLIKRERADVHLSIVGARPTPAIVALQTADPAHVTVTGRVDDVRPYGENCGVFIVPLRSGSGMRVKILTAMAQGLPVVSTTVGAEGIAVTPNENIVIADTPADFARAVLDLLADPVRARRIGEAGQSLMAARYGWDAVGHQLKAVYEELLGYPLDPTSQGTKPTALDSPHPPAPSPAPGEGEFIAQAVTTTDDTFGSRLPLSRNGGGGRGVGATTGDISWP